MLIPNFVFAFSFSSYFCTYLVQFVSLEEWSLEEQISQQKVYIWRSTEQDVCLSALAVSLSVDADGYNVPISFSKLQWEREKFLDLIYRPMQVTSHERNPRPPDPVLPLCIKLQQIYRGNEIR